MPARPHYPLLLLAVSLVTGCADDLGPAPAEPEDAPANVLVTVDTGEVVATVSDRFLSFTVDTSKAVSSTGNHYDFGRARLRTMAAELAPAWLRVGGTRADEVYYDLSDTPVEEPPEGYTRVMTRAVFDGMCDFARDLGLEMLFTLNAGPGPRDADGNWTPDNARRLLEYARESECPVDVWELGNEINGFVAAFGVDAYIDAEQYAVDMRRARQLVDSVTPEIRLAGPSSAFWPVWGEVGAILPEFLVLAGDQVDIVTWHYYPQQSDGCPIQSRPTFVDTLLQPANLDEVEVWAEQVERQASQHAPQAQVWLGETGHAQCGGDEVLSNRYVTGFWWLDQLGLMARRGEQVVMRQGLTGGHYSLIDDVTLVPRPDYFSSVLWQRLMGRRVLSAVAADLDATAFDTALLRIYAHCTPSSDGSVALVAINLDPERTARLDFGSDLGSARQLYLLTASDLLSADVLLNGEPLVVADDGSPPPMPSAELEGAIELPPLTYGFVGFPDADAPACR